MQPTRFAADLANDKGKGPLATVINACDKITCQRWGNPNAGSKELLADFWGRRTTGRPQTLLSLIPRPIGTRESSEVPMAI
jgi:hypothetical protein